MCVCVTNVKINDFLPRSETSHMTSVWELATGECKSTLEGHTNWVYSVAISPDGKTIVSGSRDNTVR